MISLGYVVTALWSWWLIWRATNTLGSRVRERRQPVAFIRRWRHSLTAFFTSTMGFYLFTWMPVLALGYFISDDAAAHSAVAVFNAAARLSQFVVLLPTMQISYLSHRFARLHHEGDLAAVSGISQSATRAAVLWGLALAGVMVAVPEVWLGIFGGYTEATTTLRILAVGALVVAALGPVNGLMLTCGFERRAGQYTLVLLILSAAVLPLLSRWGPESVAWGSAGISLAYAIASYVTLSRAGIQPAVPGRTNETVRS
jgi:O-antigen/teichoic acid export membrane protein